MQLCWDISRQIGLEPSSSTAVVASLAPAVDLVSGSSTPAGLVIPLEALAIGEGHFELDCCSHWHLVNLVLGERCSGKVGSLDPSIWKTSPTAMVISLPQIILIRVVS